jgi:hypothetical protein
MTQEDVRLLEQHHNALIYVREELGPGEIVHEETSVEPHCHLLFASTQTWRDTLKMLVKMAGRPGVAHV